MSVVMPNRDGARWLRVAAASVLAQRHPSFELIIIDDASTDGSRALVEDLRRADGRVHAVFNEKPLGIGGARNLGIAAAAGKIISLLDSDDRLTEGALGEQAALLAAAMRRRPSVRLLSTDAYTINERDERVSRYMPAEWWDRTEDVDPPLATLPSTWVFTKDLPVRFHPAWRVAEAGPFLHRVRALEGASYAGVPLVEYRLRVASVSTASVRDMLRGFAALDATLERGDWSRPVTPEEAPAPRWRDVASWKWRRIAKAAAANQRPLLAAAAALVATAVDPVAVFEKAVLEAERQICARRAAAGRKSSERRIGGRP